MIRECLTHDPVLETLVLTNSFAVAFALMLLAIEILDSLVVEQAIGMNPANSNIFIVHCPPQLRAPPCEHDTSSDCCGRDHVSKSGYTNTWICGLTVSGHHKEDHDCEGPFEVDHEEHKRDSDIRKRRQNIEDERLRRKSSEHSYISAT